MTDKQIRIDGVDVCRCRYYDDRYGYCDACRDDIDGASFTKCMYEDNCYYKQLKAKEQECEELSEWLPIVARLEEQFKSHEKAKGLSYKTYTEQVFAELDQLKAENDELRKNLVDKHTSRCFRLVTHREFDKLIMETVQLRQENKKLKQTLIEIKEIAEALDCKNPEKCWVNDISITGDCLGCEPDKYEEPRDLADCPSHLAHIILQKISEVEE